MSRLLDILLWPFERLIWYFLGPGSASFRLMEFRDRIGQGYEEREYPDKREIEKLSNEFKQRTHSEHRRAQGRKDDTGEVG